MQSDLSAQRYAEAIFGIGKDTGKLAVFEQNALEFQKLLETSQDLRISLTHPNIGIKQKEAIIGEVLQRCGYDEVFSNFLRLIVKRNRISCYGKIVSNLHVMRDESEGRIRGIVYSATKLKPSQVTALSQKIGGKMGRQVILEERLEPEILGGLRVEINGRVYDSSVRRQLEKLEESIMQNVRE